MARFALAVAWICCALGGAAGLAASEGARYPIAVKGAREGRGAVLRAYNEGPIPVSVAVDFTEIANLAPGVKVPILAVVPPGTLELGRLSPVDPKKGWGYKLRYRFRYGAYTAAHDPGALYRVPWPEGRSFVIGQAPGGTIVTHTSPASRNAVDIPMPEGTPILAARAGVVFMTVAENDTGGADEAFRSKANVVRVLHADGTIGNYVHLMHEGVAVKNGQRVEPGALIGYAGNTGLSSGPHLHFAVTRVVRNGDELEEVSEPFRFYVGDPPRVFTPQSGLAVKADYSSPGIEPQVLRRPARTASPKAPPWPASAPAPSGR